MFFTNACTKYFLVTENVRRSVSVTPIRSHQRLPLSSINANKPQHLPTNARDPPSPGSFVGTPSSRVKPVTETPTRPVLLPHNIKRTLFDSQSDEEHNSGTALYTVIGQITHFSEFSISVEQSSFKVNISIFHI